MKTQILRLINLGDDLSYLGPIECVDSNPRNWSQLIHSGKTWDHGTKDCVTTNGTWDILTVGHLDTLKVAKALAVGANVPLVIGVNSDASVKRYKGKKRPFVGELDRAEMVGQLVDAEFVVIFEQDTPKMLIETFRPSIHVNDAKYGQTCVEKPDLDKVGATLVLVAQKRKRSTTMIVEKILATRSKAK